ncbi:MAG TPA: hypothetical protein VFE62_11475 [Gemmataceae bacterium]|nr:hypothetical protein [Gemmataceae bacterium]
MKILRGILAIVVGWIATVPVIMGTEMATFVMYAGDGQKSLTERMEELQNDEAAARAFYESLPEQARVTVLVGWELGAFIGGAIAALIAGRRRVLAAGIVGTLVLAGTIQNALLLKHKIGFAHPDWMIIAGLLLPLPASLLAGKIVSWLVPAPAAPMTSVDDS